MTYGHPGYLIGANALNDPLVDQLKVVPESHRCMWEGASHIRLDNMALGYTFNTTGINGWNVPDLCNGTKPVVLTGYKGLDLSDENRNNGLAPGLEDREYYPKSRTFQ